MYSEWNSTRPPFETFVFMDLEATGLPPSRPKITEISLQAVNRHSLENTRFSNSFRPVPLYPRVVDKLCLCIDPEKHFTPTASSITGLNSEVLRNNRKQNFNMYIVDGIKAFLNRQSPPVCFVAHNGNRYDFPLLKAELFAHGISIFDNVYCADSLTAMRVLDIADNQEHQFAYHKHTKFKKPTCSLRDTYFKLFNEYPVDSHTAEGDTTALIGIFQWRAWDLMQWMDLNAKPFYDIKPMYKDTFQEEWKTVSTTKTFRNISPIQTQLVPQASERTFNCNEFVKSGGESRNFRKRLPELQGFENIPQCSSSVSDRLDWEGHQMNVYTDDRERYNLLTLMLLFIALTWCLFR